jgi:hypothetical protein
VRNAGLAVLAAVLAGGTARAASCGKPDLLESFPKDGATGVPTNATLSARYAPTADYAGEDVTLRTSGGEVPVAATFDATMGLLSVVPPEPLVAGETYTIAWPRLRGIGTASLGRGATATFVVGALADTEAPVFEGLVGLGWDVETAHDDCTDSLEDRFVVDLRPGRASDDAGRDALALYVFQTKGPHVSADAGPELLSIAPLPEPGGTVRVERSLADGAGPVCYSAFVQDLALRTSGGADAEVCATTRPPPFFYGCTLSRRSGPARAPLVLLALALPFLLVRRHRPVP